MLGQSTGFSNQGDASMKVPPKRQGMTFVIKPTQSRLPPQ